MIPERLKLNRAVRWAAERNAETVVDLVVEYIERHEGSTVAGDGVKWHRRG